MTARFKDLALDANDHQALADWWCHALGYVRRDSLTGDARAPESGELDQRLFARWVDDRDRPVVRRWRHGPGGQRVLRLRPGGDCLT